MRKLEEFSSNLKKWNSETKNAREYNSSAWGKYMVVMEELAVNGNKHGVNGDQIRKAALKKSWHERM